MSIAQTTQAIYVLSEVHLGRRKEEHHQVSGASLSLETAEKLALDVITEDEDVNRVYICRCSLDTAWWCLDETSEDCITTYIREEGKITKSNNQE